METRKYRSLVPVSWLAAVAIAGLVSMHGLDPTLLQTDPEASHGVHDFHTAEQRVHAAVGLCVFTIAASLGLAVASSTTMRWRPRILPTRYTGTEANPSVVAPDARQRLADLCVLRL